MLIERRRFGRAVRLSDSSWTLSIDVTSQVEQLPLAISSRPSGSRFSTDFLETRAMHDLSRGKSRLVLATRRNVRFLRSGKCAKLFISRQVDPCEVYRVLTLFWTSICLRHWSIARPLVFILRWIELLLVSLGKLTYNVRKTQYFLIAM